MPKPEDLVALMPYALELGIEFQEAAPERAVGSLAWRPEICTGAGIMHGGAILSLADAVGAVCAFMNLPEGAGTTTIESKTNFLRAVRGGHIRATAEPLHVGRTVIVLQTRIEGDDGRPVAATMQTQAVLSVPG
jgi:uncharacterized protein (TIGR00369 family)